MGRGPLLPPFLVFSNSSSCLKSYNFSLLFLISFFLPSKKIFFNGIFTFLKLLSQCEAKRLNRLGVTRTHQLLLLACRDCQWVHWKRMCDLSTHPQVRGERTCCWKKVSWCVTKYIHMMKRDLRTVISNDSLVPLLSLLLILAARFQSFATQRVGSFSCASMGFWRKAGSVSKAWPPTQGSCQCFQQFSYWVPSNSVSKSNLSLFRHSFSKQTLG